MGRSCLPNRVTLISFGGQSFVPRCPIDGIHRLKKSTFSQRCNSFRRNLRANGKGLFPRFFFSYQLNELFFIHPTTLRHPTFSLFFLPSDTGFCSSASERFLLFFTVSAYLSLFLYSLIPCRFFSATYHPLASDVNFLHENVLSPLLPLHLHLLTVVIFIILHRRFLFLNSYRRFHRYNFTSSCRYSNPISRRLCLFYGFFSFGFYASSDYFFRLSLSIFWPFVSRILASWDYRFWLRFLTWKFSTAYELARVFVLVQEN